MPRLSLSTSQRGQASPSGTAAVLYVQPGWGGSFMGGRGCHLGAVASGHPRGDRVSVLADDSSSESCSGNGSSTLNPSTSSSTQGDSAFPEMNGNGTAAPMDFTASADDQPINLCDKLTPAHVTPSYQSDSCSTDGLRSRVKYAVKTTAEVRGWAGLRGPDPRGTARGERAHVVLAGWAARGRLGHKEGEQQHRAKEKAFELPIPWLCPWGGAGCPW